MTITPVREKDVGLGEETDEDIRDDEPWKVIVWDDPVNTMSYVVYVFRTLFGYTQTKATKLMLQVHHEGKAVVSSGSQEKVEHDVYRLHQHGLWATMQR